MKKPWIKELLWHAARQTLTGVCLALGGMLVRSIIERINQLGQEMYIIRDNCQRYYIGGGKWSIEKADAIRYLDFDLALRVSNTLPNARVEPV